MGGSRLLTTVGELITTDGGSIKTGPFGTVLKASEYTTEGVPLISVGEIGYGSFRVDEGTPRVPKEVTSRLQEYVLAEGDIVFGRKGAVDRSARISAVQAGWFLGSDGIRLRLPATTDSRFMAFQLQSLESRNWIKQHATGTTMASLNQDVIARIPVSLPPLPEQRAIAHILGTLDDKIELNHRRNQTLEAMARALFKDWFVDFGPVRAKLEGREPYLPPDLWSLFSDRFDADGKPDGWRHSMIGSEVTVCGGSTPSTKEPAFWVGGEHHWATPKDLSALTFPVLLDTDRKITDAGIAKISSGLLPVGTVLLSSRAPIGYLAIAEVPTAINQGFIAMKCDGTLSNVFALFWCCENMDLILGNANGSTFQEISKSNFRPIPVIVPPEPILNAFRERTGPLYRHIVENERESKALAQLRDTLLPKLISGELRIASIGKVAVGKVSATAEESSYV